MPMLALNTIMDHSASLSGHPSYTLSHFQRRPSGWIREVKKRVYRLCSLGSLQ
ncbi:Hypothetical protein GbCGDNIH9_8425 [Granulibacter bethesdensis]|uniref:Uncharacterized protein n=1 Tax=Granulibacter bethesdensis TaxID=364410 RepID=A0AAC9P8B0_9PROT|nr:Hypothetical protein GbCGDNIH9_8425 [Granulibacter bethesdensis]APH61418.1 Hypothetical protein GbCGDNIH8_8425 [Granulibacter bethesdensis]